MKLHPLETERTTAATDLILALAAIAGAFLLFQRAGQSPVKAWIWIVAMACLAAASLLGAIAHGFEMSEQTNRTLWNPLNLALGLTVALFVVGVVYDLWGGGAVQWALPVMVVTGVAFFVSTLVVPGQFLYFVIYEGVAMLIAVVGYVYLGLFSGLAGAWLLAAGAFVTLIAAAIQAVGRARFRLIWQFDHNGIFHLVQLPGLALIVAGVWTGLGAASNLMLF